MPGLIAFYDVAVLDLANPRDRLCIDDAAAGRLVDLSEADLVLVSTALNISTGMVTKERRRYPFQ